MLFRRTRPLARTAVLVALLCSTAFAQRPDPLPVDTGATGLKLVLRQLQTTARLMHTTAHPDDEDGGMLTFEARGQGVDTLLLTLTRGEGGQNKTGSNLFDELGVLRTLELLESGRYYGVQQRFTRVADFGYSKNAEETFQKWHGHDIALGDMVRVIRTFRPDVIVSRFQGASRDGHGHHEAAGILSREAFRAAADPNRFPEQIREGLQPWQAKKLYVDNVRAGEDYTVKFETTVTDPLLGKSYAQFAMDGLKHQLSQGAGAWNLPPGPRYSTYKLVDSVLPPATDKDGHEKSFFDGIDMTISGLAERFDDRDPEVRLRLKEIEQHVNEAVAAAEQDASRITGPLTSGLDATNRLIAHLKARDAFGGPGVLIVERMLTKREQFEHAINLALGLTLTARAEIPQPGGFDPVVAAGDSFLITATLQNSGKGTIIPQHVSLETPPGWQYEFETEGSNQKMLAPGEERTVEVRVMVPANARLARPYFQRSDPESQTVYSLIDPAQSTRALPSEAIKVKVDYSGLRAIGTISTIVSVDIQTSAGAKTAPVAVAPPVSVLLNPSSQVLRTGAGRKLTVSAVANSYRQEPIDANVHLEIPAGWQVVPPSGLLHFTKHDEQKSATFDVTPAMLAEQHYTIRAIAQSGGKTYTEGFSIVTRDDLGVFYYYQPAIQKISAVNVNIPDGLKIGYVMGAGDDIPTALQQLGLDVHLITPDELATSDLSRFGTIVLGIRAYDIRGDLKQHNARLLDYVKNGGTLIVQYNAGVQDFNSGNFTPYPAQLGRERVSVEEAPVQVLAPADPIFHYPNEISAHDFDAWVQERGLYFMTTWDKQYEPLLASNDPGEQPLQGGLLRARYGKGTYIYTGYAFFRQLPAGVPGAVRLFVNLISAGHNQQASQTSNQSPAQ